MIRFAMLLLASWMLWIWTMPVARANGYSNEEILTVMQDLAKKKELPKDKVAELAKNLEASFKDSWFSKERSSKPVNGIMVFRAGEGGLVVKFLKGDGLVSFKKGKQAGEVEIKSWSAGAQAGGSAMWGVALVMGLGKDSDFGSDYTGKTMSATAADFSAKNAVLLELSDDDGGKKAHQLYILYAGIGLSAGVGGARMTVTPAWE